MAVRDVGELWVIQEDKLDVVKQKVAVPEIQRVSAGVDASIVYAGHTSNNGGNIYIIDAKKGTVLNLLSNIAARLFTASPDGKYVFAVGSVEQIVRYRVQADRLVEEETSFRLGANPGGIWISPDSQYVSMPTGGGNAADQPNHPPRAPYVTYLYAATDLKRPVGTYAGGAYPRALGIDPKGGHVLAQNFQKPVMVFSFSGDRKFFEHTCAPLRNLQAAEFAVAPAGSEALLRADNAIVHIKINRPGTPP